jgi:hypothetical protein
MLEKSTLNGTDVVLTAQANAIENFVVCDLPGFADFADQLPTEKKNVGKEGTRWWGGMTYQKSVTALRNGDMAGVPASDKLLAEMETLCRCRGLGALTTASSACVRTCRSTLPAIRTT